MTEYAVAELGRDKFSVIGRTTPKSPWRVQCATTSQCAADYIVHALEAYRDGNAKGGTNGGL